MFVVKAILSKEKKIFNHYKVVLKLYYFHRIYQKNKNYDISNIEIYK
jgi:hypothetical protein